MRSQVQLDVELAEFVLHVRPAQAGQDRVTDQPRSAQRIDEIELHLHPDGVLVGVEPAVGNHAPQDGYAPLEPVPHRVLVDNKGGWFDAFTHVVPPRGTPWGELYASWSPHASAPVGAPKRQPKSQLTVNPSCRTSSVNTSLRLPRGRLSILKPSPLKNA